MALVDAINDPVFQEVQDIAAEVLDRRSTIEGLVVGSSTPSRSPVIRTRTVRRSASANIRAALAAGLVEWKRGSIPASMWNSMFRPSGTAAGPAPPQAKSNMPSARLLTTTSQDDSTPVAAV
jgi:hypothetical protein